MSILHTILRHKAAEVEKRGVALPVEMLKKQPLFGRVTLPFSRALSGPGTAVIAEVKKGSPSLGLIRDVFDPVGIAREYERAGASAISVVTDEQFFHGSTEMLESVRLAVSLPLLRKDFIIAPYQVYEAKAAGADAVLLIAAALSPALLAELHARAHDLGLECLVEVHTERELEIANQLGCPLIGINNRDLTTFTTDLGTSFRLAPIIRRGAVRVSESGIRTRDDILALAQSGIHAVLIGEAFLRSPSPGGALAELLANTEPKK